MILGGGLDSSVPCHMHVFTSFFEHVRSCRPHCLLVRCEVEEVMYWLVLVKGIAVCVCEYL